MRARVAHGELGRIRERIAGGIAREKHTAGRVDLGRRVGDRLHDDLTAKPMRFPQTARR